MGAGGSDYGSLAQGGFGQGFAQGVESGLEQYNKGVDKKTAQANMYLQNYIAPNIARLSKPIEFSPDDTEDERDTKIQMENARREQMNVLKGQAGKYLSTTQSPLSADEFIGLYYDPTTEIKAEDWAGIVGNRGKYKTVTGQLKELEAKIIETDPSSELYNVYMGQYNKIVQDNDYGGLYKQQHQGVEWSQVVGTPEETRARRVRTIEKANETKVNSVLSTLPDNDPTKIALNDAIAAGKNIYQVDPNTGKSILQLAVESIDVVALSEGVKKGDANAIRTLLYKADGMNADQIAELDDESERIVNSFRQYREKPESILTGPLKEIFNSLATSDLEITKAKNYITIQGKEIAIQTQKVFMGEIDMEAAFGELAQKGNKSVQNMRPQWEEQMKRKNPNITQEQLDQKWYDTVSVPLENYDKSVQNELDTAKQKLLGLDLANKQGVGDLVSKGQFHIQPFLTVDSNGNVTAIDKTHAGYKHLEAIYGGPIPDEVINQWAKNSYDYYNDADVQRNADLLSTQAGTRLTTAQATSAEAFAKYAGVKAQAEAGITLSQAVKELGVGIMDKPEWKDNGVKLFGEEGWNSMKTFMQTSEKFRRDEEAGQLTIMGQQISRNAIDEFDKVFSSPGALEVMLKKSPEEFAKWAKAAGITDVNGLRTVMKAYRDNYEEMRTLGPEQIRHSMWAEGQRIAQGAEANAIHWWQVQDDSAQGWEGLSIQRGRLDLDTWQAHDSSKQGWTSLDLAERKFGFEQTVWKDQVSFRDREAVLQHQEEAERIAQGWQGLGLQEADSIRDYDAQILGSVDASLERLGANLVSKTGEFQNFAATYQNGLYAGFLTTKVRFDPVKNSSGQIIGTKAVLISNNAADRTTFNTLNSGGALKQAEELMTPVLQTQSEIEAGNAHYQSLVQIAQSHAPYYQPPQGGTVNSPAGTATGNVDKFNAKNYISQAPTRGASGLATSVNKAVSGSYKVTAYSGMYLGGRCTTLLQAVYNDNLNIPNGMPTGNAKQFYNGLLNRGAISYGGGKRLTTADISKLPDGTLLYQDYGDPKVNHTAMVIGGVVVQSSDGNWNFKRMLGPVGYMDMGAFINTAPTYAAIPPASWYKNQGANPTAAPGARGGGQAPAAQPQQSTSGGGRTDLARSKYSTLDNQFNPDLTKLSGFLAGKLQANQGVRVTTKPGGNSGLTVQIGKDRYAMISDSKVAAQAIDVVASQFGIHYQSNTGKSLKTVYQSGAKGKNQVRYLLTTELKNSGYMGDVNGFLTRWFKERGW